MKTLKLKSYSDDSHGWIAVKKQVLIDLGILDIISFCSYVSKSGSTIYLEEDSDANKFINRANEKGLCVQLTHVRHEGSSWIRSLNRFVTETNRLNF
jgi:hypothetical protein